MRKLSVLALLICFFLLVEYGYGQVTYPVKKLKKEITINGDWQKPGWQRIKSIKIINFMGAPPPFKPVAEAKMMYDDEFLYLIYRVEDRHVRIQTRTINGPVSGDACVEFFFSPDGNFPGRYFNLEINAGGVPLMGYHINGHKEYTLLHPEELSKLKIAHSLPENLDREIECPVMWTIECQIPISLLKKYSFVNAPEKGVRWKANFYKTSSRSSNPHWITWAPVNSPKPNFHLPVFFGTLVFK